ncbi:glutamine amidotransferase [Ruania halotolerans]|uniref:glutamine amidotransferase n=1 Tax=Ruania halotolerans TaxID=2897773 RepID=UPI001E379F1F|nr:glutamine amidotransferase [Ruania halotolerans]UFU07772.1 glutamine amidotransferase [Ruania halotolerans]
MIRPLCFLASRSEDVAADAEYASVLEHTGLSESELVRVRLDRGDHVGELTQYSGVILGGSPFTVTTPELAKSPVQRAVEATLLDVLNTVTRHQVPFLGLCYGVGIVGTWAGGQVDRTYAEDTDAVEIALTQAARTDPLLADMPGRFTAYVGHKEACSATPPGAVVLATSAACPVQMYRFGPGQYVTQFHPEMDADAVRLRIEVYADAGYFAPDAVAEVIARTARADVSAAHRVLSAFAALCVSADSAVGGEDLASETRPQLPV